MKLYSCSRCENPLYFENNVCLSCRNAVGFNPQSLTFISLQPSGKNTFLDFTNPRQAYRYCSNARYGTCNWLVPADSHTDFCQACQLNHTIPDLQLPENLKRWKRIETAKHRLVYSLLRLNLPIVPKQDEDDTTGLAFDFMADTDPAKKVMTGHASGTITLNIDEADEVERIKHKNELGENYRTLLGHFRHEVGHYYWEVLVRDSDLLTEYRALFGDERQDYAQALKKYYDSQPPANWRNNYISIYATAHSWEDWAETWANYLHLMDTLETAFSFGITINPVVTEEPDLNASISRDPYQVADFDRILKMWMPLTFALNSLNRSMGHPDFYPFIISAAVGKKMKFIHKVCRMSYNPQRQSALRSRY